MADWSWNIGNPPGIGFTYTQDPWLTLSQQQFDVGAQQWTREFDEEVRQFDERLAQDYETALMEQDAATERARIAAAASTGAADTYAQAEIRAAEIAAAEARYHADTLMKIAQLDNATKLQISREANKIEAMKWESTQFQHPSKWAEQEAWFAAGGAPAIETPTRSVVPQMPSGGEIPGMQAPQTPRATWGAPQRAIAGEAGAPELVSATPGGAEVTPLDREQYMRLKSWGVPGMQWGGQVKHQAGGTSQADMGLANWQRQRAATQGAVQSAQMGMFPPSTPYNVGRTRYPTWTASQARPPGPGGGAGGGGNGGGAGGGANGAAAGGETADPQRSVLSYLRGDEPFPGWGGQELGEFQIPGGANYGIVPLPGSINLADFQRMPYDMQQMYLSATEATYSMTPEQTMQWMTYFAPRGIASPVATWG